MAFIIHDSLRALLEAEGMAIVPKEPTQKMIEAARRSWLHDQGPKATALWGSEAADIYRAMLRAGAA